MPEWGNILLIVLQSNNYIMFLYIKPFVCKIHNDQLSHQKQQTTFLFSSLMHNQNLLCIHVNYTVNWDFLDVVIFWFILAPSMKAPKNHIHQNVFRRTYEFT
jgi:hypothetical protein